MNPQPDPGQVLDRLPVPGDEPARYRKRPVEITAVQWRGDNAAELRSFVGYTPDSTYDMRFDGIRFGEDGTGEVYDYLHDVWVPFKLKDWILCGIKHEFYPCAEAVFAATYEPADGTAEAEVGVAMIAAERTRQAAVKGYTPEHDAEHRNGEMAEMAASYALAACGEPAAREFWPFALASFKPGPKPVDALVKAGAMCAAEIDRIVAEEGL